MSKSAERIARLLANEAPVKWVFAGDSITHGALHTYGHRDYVEHFAERIRWELKRMRDAIITTAASGWRITNIQADLEWNILQYAPQVVSINVGMNDCTAGAEGVEQFRKVYNAVLARLRQEGKPALILHVPNAIYQAGEGRSPLGLYAQAVRELAGAHGAVLVDHERDWLALRERQKNLLYYLSDEGHPNEYGHRLMAHSLLRALGLFAEDSAVCRLFVP